ncbi:unnamed protein product [Owenia fusiformis]|uniref:Guanylate cyclase n=1 Tax=Owenia fusiformis TaxID=6347 RepID=A0A8S4Q3I1_OWEFU|nr:unnamed protein product [Owenia fusiformis]
MESSLTVFSLTGLWRLVIMFQANSVVNGVNIKLGLLLPREGLQGYLGFETNAAATTMAIDKCRSDGLMDGHNITILYRDTKCTEKYGLGMAVELYMDEHVDAFIGPACSEATIPVGHLAAFWNVPLFAHASSDPSLADKVRFNTVVRVLPPYNKMGSAFVELFKYYGWNRCVMLYTRTYNMISFAARSVEKKFRENNVTLADTIDVEVVSNSDIDGALERFQHRGRIIIVLLEADDIRRVMVRARKMGMTNGQYVFVSSLNIVPIDEIRQPWVANNSYDAEAKEAFQSLIHITVATVKSDRADAFRAEIPYRMAEPPWNFNRTELDGTTNWGQVKYQGSVFSLFLYDTVYLYCLALNYTSSMGMDNMSGKIMMDVVPKLQFDGMSGRVIMDDQAERESDYWVWHLPPHKDEYEYYAEIKNTNKEGEERIHVLSPAFWRTPDGHPPKDTPDCGFFTEACQKNGLTTHEIGIIVGILATFVLVGAISTIYYLFRRRKLEGQLEFLSWKVDFDEISFAKVTHMSKTMAGAGGKSAIKSIGGSTHTAGTSTTVSSKDDEGVTDTEKTSKVVGLFKGNLVFIKYMNVGGMILGKKDHKELKLMREMNHHNVNAFVGVCFTPGKFCILTAFCSKRSLQDVLSNDDIKLDWMFKSSLISDLVAGMDHIHSCPILSHGNLKSSNCVIDGRWILKVTDFGLHRFKLAMQRKHSDGEYAAYYTKLWTAPELLRMPIPPLNGTPKGDIYSFAIILQEVIYRAGPYHSVDLAPKEIIERVTRGDNPPYRPEVREDKDAKPDMIELMRDCWHENPFYRPDFCQIKKKLSGQNDGRKFNIMDKMLTKMETYTENLEELIEQRTTELIEEKKKTDILLYRMLPAAIADSLKMGHVVEPEVYEQVTAFFSDIVEFTSFTTESSPIEIVNLLNDLYTLLDNIISRCDVYKVETIGDSYMVVSGLPTRNGIQHVANIADMSLEMLASIANFRVRHMPRRKLQMRIGMHTGTCAAGVVGTTMPRYCLFGDSINMASRMESTSEGMRIQMSPEANGLLSKHVGYLVKERGEVEIKGRGKINTFWLEGKKGFYRRIPKPGETMDE